MTPELKSKLKLTFLLLITALPVTMATLSFNSADNSDGSSATSNKGTLINPPADISVLAMHDVDNNPVFKSFEEVIAALPNDQEYEIQPWLMVYVNADDCAEACKERIHILKQLHIALGKNTQRVRRYYLNASDRAIAPEVAELFRNEYPSMGVAQSDKALLGANLIEAGTDIDLSTQTYVILIDPVGNVMMYYTEDQEAEDIMSDLETLLKYSSLG
ncbi:MAG: hypothetical protein ACSHXZ_04315 [Gammaproteobacteria bacterium]